MLFLQEDLLIHGDSVYDIIDKQDHQAIQVELGRTPGSGAVDDVRIFLCRMNVSRNARRQMRFGDQKVLTHTFHTTYPYYIMMTVQEILIMALN